MSMRHLTLLVSFLFVLSDGLLIQNLGGEKWTAWNDNQSIRVASRVPGSIYSDLERANVIENIYKDFNDVKYRWISYQNWTFARNFDVSDVVLSMDNIYLVCHGLDTIAQVSLNGHQLGTVDNMFVRYKWPIKTLLKNVQNVIQIRFLSAPEYAKQHYIRTMLEKYIIPPTCTPAAQNGECHVNFVRKMQSSFSWDWGPAFPTQGIWRPIMVEAYNELTLRSVSVATHQDHTGQWLLNCTVFVESVPASGVSGNLSIYLNGTLLSASQFNARFDSVGEATLTAFLLIPTQLAIKPWFPNGVGPQHLYPLTVQISTPHEFTNKSINIGFRTIRLVQDRLPSSVEAYSFYFEVNGLPIFSKGSNWIPAHVLHESYSESYIEDLLLSAKLANMNMLRVWGGGIYEDDRFYELADKYGILIWQDMMFACALYPTDVPFLSSVAKEIQQQVRRLQYHPSIAVWAGNNENEAAIAQGWWPIEYLHFKNYTDDYRTLYIKTIMPIVLKEDQTRPYLPSSPSNGIVSPRENFVSGNPQSNIYGDVHFYYVFGDVWKWQIYPSAKFVSEYGFQSWSSLATLQKYISAEYLRYPLESALQHREHQENGLHYLFNMITENLPLPSNGSLARLDDFIYLSQVHQSMAIKTETEFYRRNRQIKDNGEGFTMGALYWQLNDIWPTVSWASVEFGGKWKMLHYYARNIFDNLLVDIFEENDALKVAIVRDDHIPESIQFQGNIEVFNWDWQMPIFSQKLTTFTKPFSVTLAFEQNMQSFLQRANCRDRNQCFVQVTISCRFQDELIERKNFLLLERIKNAIGLQKAQIRVSDVRGPVRDAEGVNTFQISLQTDRVAPFVWLDFAIKSPVTGIFSDNGFILANQTLIAFKTRDNISKSSLINSLVIKSLKDVK